MMKEMIIKYIYNLHDSITVHPQVNKKKCHHETKIGYHLTHEI